MVKWYRIPDNDKLRPFTFIVGGRGIGKTYSAVDRCITDYPGKFLYMRNTKEQLQESCGGFGNPFKKWSKDHNRDITMKLEKSHAVVNELTMDEEKRAIITTIGYGANLSTFENLRGVDLSDCDIGLFDEFIENKTLTFDQFKAFVQMYETVNRNREILGQEPFKVILLSNSQRLGNPILRGFNLIPVIENMQKTGQRSYAAGPIRIELPFSSVSDEKRETALYKATQGTAFASEALDNNFVNDSFSGVKKVNIMEYSPICCIDDIYIYRHKSEPIYYACSVPAQVKKYRSKDNFMVFYRIYGFTLKIAYGSDKLYFSDYSTKVDLMTILKMLY